VDECVDGPVSDNSSDGFVFTEFELEMTLACVETFIKICAYNESRGNTNIGLKLLKHIIKIGNFNYIKYIKDSLNIDINELYNEYMKVSFEEFDSKHNKTIIKIFEVFKNVIVDFIRVDNNEEYICKLLKVDDVPNQYFYKTMYAISRNETFKNILNISTNLVYSSDSLRIKMFREIFNLNINPFKISHPLIGSSSVDNDIAMKFETGDDIYNVLFIESYDTYEQFTAALLGRPSNIKCNLNLNNFSRYKDDFDKISKIISTKNKGINILVCGEPGTGKTEFVKLWCKKNKYNSFFIDADTHDSSRARDLMFKEQLCGDSKSSILIFDEAQDFFGNNIFDSAKENKDILSKSKVNKFLESNETPIIWITNKIYGIDPAYLSRFQYIIKMDENTNQERKKCIENILKYENYEPNSTQDIIDVSNKYKLVYRDITKFIDNMINIKGDSSDYVQMVEKYCDIRGFDSTVNDLVENYDLSLINTDIDIASLVDEIVNNGEKNFSLLLYGVPGTGKSEFAKYLASRLNMEYIKKRCSDIMSMWVGETEQNIKKAFIESKNNEALLLFDEADSFLQDRTGAQRSWEVTNVNEMLTQMESSQYPFVATTNLIDNIDQAAFRRFDYKIKYSFMTLKQIVKALDIFFKIKSNQKDIKFLNKMTPGDFKCVSKQLRFIKDKSKEHILELLAKEQEYKKEKRTIGL